MKSFRPLIRGLSISSQHPPSSRTVYKFPSPHPGIINFFISTTFIRQIKLGFRPLIRGLSISSTSGLSLRRLREVSVPSSGDYQFLHSARGMVLTKLCFRPLIRGLSISSWVPGVSGEAGKVSVPSSGDYQFLHWFYFLWIKVNKVSVPSSGDYQFLHTFCSLTWHKLWVSVPSSGDYQFLHIFVKVVDAADQFPSPHPGIINFFPTNSLIKTCTTCFRPLIRGLSISSRLSSLLLRTLRVSVPSSGDYQFLPYAIAL